MASHDAKLGIGLASGMFYHAPAGTALPSYPSATLGGSWVEVGDVTQDGITLALNKTTEALKNWANVTKRVILTDHSETIEAPIQDTTAEVFKTIVGADNVTITPANSTHGNLVSVALSESSLPAEEAFLFLMKDEDDMIAIGCTNAQITSIANVTFAPNGAIVWTPTITALESGWKLITDDGDVTS